MRTNLLIAALLLSTTTSCADRVVHTPVKIEVLPRPHAPMIEPLEEITPPAVEIPKDWTLMHDDNTGRIIRNTRELIRHIYLREDVIDGYEKQAR